MRGITGTGHGGPPLSLTSCAHLAFTTDQGGGTSKKLWGIIWVAYSIFLLSKKTIYTTQRRSMQILRGDECVATNPRRRLSTATRTANDRLRCLSRCFHRLFFALLQTCRHADIAVFSAVSFFLDSPLLPWTVSDHSTMIHTLTSATNHGVYNSTSFESKR